MRPTRTMPSVAPPLMPSRRAPWLGLVGLLMLILGFASYNGCFGFAARRWPWDMLTDAAHDLHSVAVLAAWLVTGVWLAALAFTPAPRTRAVGAALLAGLLLTEAARCAHPLLDVLTPHALLRLLTTATFGAGLLLLREPAVRARGRVLAGLGGLLFLWLLALPGPDHLLEDLVRNWRGVFGEGGPDTQQIFTRLVPLTLVALAAVGAVLAALGMAGRRVVLVWFFALLAGWLMATGAAFAVADHGEGVEGLGASLVAMAVRHDLLPWSLVLFTVHDLGRLVDGDA